MFYRRWARFYLGQFSLAKEDFQKAQQLEPASSFAAMDGYLVQARTGESGLSDLQTHTAKLDLDTWPGPVIKLYLGSATPDAVLLAAKDANPKHDREQHCDAYFYLGQHALLHGHLEEAVRLFRKAVETGAFGTIAHAGAKEELRRLSAAK